MVKWELSLFTSLSTFIYVHRLWVMTERIRSQIQEVEISSLCRVAGLCLRDRARSSVIQETRSRAATPPHGKETVEVVQASGNDASWTPPQRGASGLTGRRHWGRPMMLERLLLGWPSDALESPHESWKRRPWKEKAGLKLIPP